MCCSSRSFIDEKVKKSGNFFVSAVKLTVCLDTVKSKVINSKTTESRHFDEVVISIK